GNKLADAGFQVHLLDQRNHGRSPHTSEMTYKAMAEDVYNYCKEHQLEHVILLGHSMGGKTAMYAAAEYPELFDKLVVVDISPKYYAPHHQKIMEGLAALDKEKFTSRGDAEDFLKKFIPDTGTRLFLLKNLYWKTKEHLALRLNLDVLKEAMPQIGEALPAGFKFEKPVLFIKGEKSDYIQNEDENLISVHFPKYKIVTIPEAGHWVHAENMEVFYEKLMLFV
ncbi:MAG: alpha/beta fold hydrolase, partial [Gillisia sp.]